MRKFITILVMLITGACFSIDAFAQFNYSSDIKYKAFGKYVNSDKEPISKVELESYLTPYEYSQYETAKRKLYTGYALVGVSVVGYTCAIVSSQHVANQNGGGVVYVDDIMEAEGASPAFFIYGAFVGSICLVTGVPKVIIGHTRLNNVARKHNKTNNQDLSFKLGGTSDGFGLTFNF